MVQRTADRQYFAGRVRRIRDRTTERFVLLVLPVGEDLRSFEALVAGSIVQLLHILLAKGAHKPWYSVYNYPTASEWTENYFVIKSYFDFLVLRDVENLSFRHKKESKEYKADMENLIRRYMPLVYKTRVSISWFICMDVTCVGQLFWGRVEKY